MVEKMNLQVNQKVSGVVLLMVLSMLLYYRLSVQADKYEDEEEGENDSVNQSAGKREHLGSKLISIFVFMMTMRNPNRPGSDPVSPPSVRAYSYFCLGYRIRENNHPRCSRAARAARAARRVITSPDEPQRPWAWLRLLICL